MATYGCGWRRREFKKKLMTLLHMYTGTIDRATKNQPWLLTFVHFSSNLEVLTQVVFKKKKKLLSESKPHEYSPESPHLSSGQRESNLPFS